MTDNTKTLTALLIGAAAGAVLGILFAPDRGDNTRSKLMNYARSKGLDDYIEDGVDYAKRKVEEGKEKVSALGNEIHSKANELASKAESAKDKLKSEFEDTKGRSRQQYT